MPDQRAADGPSGVAGTADESLTVVQVSKSAETLLQMTAEDVVGRSLLSLLTEPDRARAMAGVVEAAETGCAITVFLAAPLGCDPAGPVSGCELMVVPLWPSPSCIFVLSPTGLASTRPRHSEAIVAVLARLATRVDGSGRPTDVVPPGQVLPGRAGLTPREREVLTLIAAGHRVSAIARSLFLSESTVRTHVSAVERKLGVSTQQGLRELCSPRPEHAEPPPSDRV